MMMNIKLKQLLYKSQLVILDIFLITATYTMTVAMLRVIGLRVVISEAFYILPLLVVFKILLYWIFGLYRMLLAHVGFEDLMKIILVTLITNAVIFTVFMMMDVGFIHPFALIFITPIEVTVIALPRVVKRLIIFTKNHLLWSPSQGKRTLIVGAGSAGEIVLKELYRNRALQNVPVAFIDDDPLKLGKDLLGVKIIGPIAHIEAIILEYNIDEVIIAISTLSTKRLRDLLELIAQNDVKIRRIPLMHETSDVAPQKLMDVKVEDLLNRDEVILDTKGIENFIQGETVLITGGGGSIGSELVRQIARYHPKQLIIFDIYENNAYEIQMELERFINRKELTIDLAVCIGSVYDAATVEDLFATYKPTLIFHAAAYKHVPLMETAPKEAVRTNIIGTYYVAQAAIKHKVKHMLLVSSDKAVRPTNIMGASKRYAELIVHELNQQSKTTKFASVRFGNVLGSNGSVIPLFRKQIQEGGPLTVTHPDITRYFMTIPEAVGLILECALYSKGGEIFILDMGAPIKIKDLAEKMIRLAGLQPKSDIDIMYTGLRPGEKLYEELLVDQGKDKIETNHQKIFIESNAKNGDTIDINQLLNAFSTTSTKDIKQTIAKHIQSYQAMKPSPKKH